MTLYLKLKLMKAAVRCPGEAYEATPTGGGHWDKYFWIRVAGF